MAALRVLSRDQQRMTLGKGGANSIGTIIGVIIFAVVAFVGLGSFLDSGGDLNPGVIVIGLIVAVIVFSNLISALRSTRVVLDAGQGVISRVDSVFLVPVRRSEIPLNSVRNIRVTKPRALARYQADESPIWSVQLSGTDGATFVVNDRGTRNEMNALAQQVSDLIKRPIEGPQTQPNQMASNQPSTTPSPAAVMGSIFGNLSSFAQAAGPLPIAPTISAYPAASNPPMFPSVGGDNNSSDAPYARASERLAAEQSAADFSVAAANARLAASEAAAGAPSAQASLQLSGLQDAMTANNAAANQSVSNAETAAGAPFDATSARFAQQQGASQFVMGYSLPPALSMPQMPVLSSFGPAMDFPSFPPLGTPLPPPTPVAPPTPEVKQVEAKVTPSRTSRSDARQASNDPTDAQAQYRMGRQLLMQRNWRDAQATLERAIGLNPSDAAVQNDLGVVYLEQNKLPDAERAFRRGMALDPFTSTSRYNLGLTLYRMGKRREAAEQFNLGAQNANRNDAPRFQSARQGALGAPMTSPQDQIFSEATR